MRTRVLVIGALLVVGAACGRGALIKSSFISDAAVKTLAAKSAKVSLTMSGFPSGQDIPPTFHGEGLLDFVNDRAEFTFGTPADGADSETVIYANGSTYTPLPAEVQKQVKTHAKWVREGTSGGELFGAGGLSNI